MDDALEVHKSSPVDIILVDLTGESEEESTEFIHTIRAIPKSECDPPKIICLLGQGTEEALRLSISMGADSAWVKPISPKALRKQLEHVLRSKIPYYEVEGYVGPDRRRVPDEAEYDGQEKRK